jgi:DNA-binding winged helix-turn-helix (wHTH) protein
VKKLPELQNGFRLGDQYVLDADSLQLSCDKDSRRYKRARLRPQVLKVLLELLKQPGARVDTENLLDLLWRSSALNITQPERAIGKIMQTLRRAFRDSVHKPRYIETIPRQGYRFIASVERIDSRKTHSIPEPKSDPIGTVEEGELPEIDESEIVGRTSEVDRICDSLLTTKGRVLSLLGEGGVGKTTIALMVRQRLKAEFRGGVWFVKLSSFNSPERLASYIAGLRALPFAVGEQFTNVNTTPREKIEELAERALIAHFQSLERLLILDNCEHLGPAVGALLTTLVRECPDLHVLTISRRSLDLLVIEDPYRSGSSRIQR